MMPPEMETYNLARKRMVDRQVRGRGIANTSVIRALTTVPRHLFVENALAEQAYSDFPLPIGFGQTISQPYIVALMSEALELTGVEKVLEIGTGSGYQTAVLAELAGRVISVERILPLVTRARNMLEKLGYHRVVVHQADGSIGWREMAPYDAILVTAGSPDIPGELIDQLAEGGRLVIPSGGRKEQKLLKVTFSGGERRTENLGGCVFVPLVGKRGWSEGD